MLIVKLIQVNAPQINKKNKLFFYTDFKFIRGVSMVLMKIHSELLRNN